MLVSTTQLRVASAAPGIHGEIGQAFLAFRSEVVHLRLQLLSECRCVWELGIVPQKIDVFQMFSWQNREKMIRIFDRPSNLTGFTLNYLNCQAQNLTSPWDVWCICDGFGPMSCQREWALVMKIYGMNFWCVLKTSSLGLVCLACILAIHCWYF